MKNDLHKRLLQREMTRKEFLQYVAGSLVLLFGFTNLASMFTSFTKVSEPQNKSLAQQDGRHGFGSRKFGV